MPTRASSVSSTGSWKQRPKAKISFMTSESTRRPSAAARAGGIAGRAGGLEAEEERPGQGQHDVVEEGAAHQEHDRRRDQERQEGRLLVLVEAGRDEQPDLGGDNGKGDDEGAEERAPSRG